MPLQLIRPFGENQSGLFISIHLLSSLQNCLSMKKLIIYSLCFCLFSCGSKAVQDAPVAVQENTAEASVSEGSAPVVTTSAVGDNNSLPEPESKFIEGDNGDYEEYAIYYVTIADTGKSYYPLREKMMALSQALPLAIDTMGRYYDAKKKMIVLPEDDEDEVFAGDYFPRRGPDVHLSLEYLDLYQKKAGKKTIALVSGIYEKKTSADSALRVMKSAAGGAFVVKTEMYMGCIH